MAPVSELVSHAFSPIPMSYSEMPFIYMYLLKKQCNAI